MSGATVVTFDYSGWIARYPEFSAVIQATAQLYFNEATLYLDNTSASVVADASPGGARATLLNMLTAHIAALNMAGSSPLVGRINSATEGSVSVGTDYAVPGTAAWFAQTKYGAAYWQAVLPYRTMRYYAPVQPFVQPLGNV